MDFAGYIDRFHDLKNRGVWENFYSHIADELTRQKISLDNVFFVNTPAFVAYYSENDGTIIDRPASHYAVVCTRTVLIEKNFNKKKEICFYDRQYKAGDKMLSKPLATFNYRLNWNESAFGQDFDLMEALKKFLNSKKHLAVFLYVDASFFDTLKSTKIVRLATLDTSQL